jgi:uncharacterized membrane protein YhhN
MSYVAVALLAALADLVAAALGWEPLRIATKPLPALILALAVFRARGAPRAFGAGLLLAAAGDELLLHAGDAAFMAGMAAFAAMHACYIAAFARLGSGAGLVRRIPWLVLPYALAAIGSAAVLWPYAGRFAAAVAAYGLLLAAMAIAALDAAGRVANPFRSYAIAGGALIFMLSDTLLASAKFLPGFPLAGASAELAVMASYFLAQIAIAAGVLYRNDDGDCGQRRNRHRKGRNGTALLGCR